VPACCEIARLPQVQSQPLLKQLLFVYSRGPCAWLPLCTLLLVACTVSGLSSMPRLELSCCCHCAPQGAPYAYTPFCDTNKETEPFRWAVIAVSSLTSLHPVRHAPQNPYLCLPPPSASYWCHLNIGPKCTLLALHSPSDVPLPAHLFAYRASTHKVQSETPILIWQCNLSCMLNHMRKTLSAHHV
jgi:hypothetical protein